MEPTKLSDDPRFRQKHQEEETCQINILFGPLQQKDKFCRIQLKKGNEKFSHPMYWDSSTDEDEDEYYTPTRFEGIHTKPPPVYYHHSDEEWYSSSSSDSDDDKEEEEKSDFLAESLLLELEKTIQKIVNELKQTHNQDERVHMRLRSNEFVIKSTDIDTLKKKIKEKVQIMDMPVDINDDPEKMSLNFKRGHESSLRQVCVECLENAEWLESQKEELKKQIRRLKSENRRLGHDIAHGKRHGSMYRQY